MHAALGEGCCVVALEAALLELVGAVCQWLARQGLAVLLGLWMCSRHLIGDLGGCLVPRSTALPSGLPFGL